MTAATKNDIFFNGSERVALLRAGAEQWNGTPFHKGAAVLGRQGGVDCVRLCVAVYGFAGFELSVKWPEYSINGGAHAESDLLGNWLIASGCFERVPSEPERQAFRAYTAGGCEGCDRSVKPAPLDYSVKSGDLLVFRIGKQPYHCGIYIGADRFFHSAQPHGARYNFLTDSTYASRLCSVWRPIK